MNVKGMLNKYKIIKPYLVNFIMDIIRITYSKFPRSDVRQWQ